MLSWVGSRQWSRGRWQDKEKLDVLRGVDEESQDVVDVVHHQLLGSSLPQDEEQTQNLSPP